MSGAKRDIADWTTGEASHRLSVLRGLRRAAVFPSQLLRACGAPDPARMRASGKGTVYATSLVCRAATPETRAHVPYNILLVDTAEGFRMMAHGDRISPSAIR